MFCQSTYFNIQKMATILGTILAVNCSLSYAIPVIVKKKQIYCLDRAQKKLNLGLSLCTHKSVHVVVFSQILMFCQSTYFNIQKVDSILGTILAVNCSLSSSFERMSQRNE
jgi:hypothetical protein